MAAAETWDIVNAIAQSVGAIGTTGALIVAARVYRRQVEDKRREQAAHVVLARMGDTGVAVVNHSTLPVSNMIVYRLLRQPPDRIATRATLDPGERVEVDVPRTSTFDISGDRRWVIAVEFEDSAGSRWERFGDGRPLHEMRVRGRFKLH